MCRPGTNDVFLHHAVCKVVVDDVLNDEYVDAILSITDRRLKDNEALQEYISTQLPDRIGKYIIVAL